MIQPETTLKIADNSGAVTAKCIKILGGFKRKKVSLGNFLTVSIKKLRNRSKKTSRVNKKDIYKALLIRTKTKHKIKNGFEITFGENAVVLLNKQNNPIGSRIIGPLTKNLKKKKFQKVISISSGFI